MYEEEDMDTNTKIKLPIPFEPTQKELKQIKKLETKLQKLNKTGSGYVFTFAGTKEIETMYYLYLFKKYKSNCLVHRGYRNGGAFGLSIEISKNYSQNQIEQLQFRIKDLAKVLVNCIKTPDTNIIVIPVSLWLIDTDGGHANVLIYRKKLNQLEHFEPHGSIFLKNNQEKKIVYSWILYFCECVNQELSIDGINQDINLIRSEDVCPYIDGLQNLESSSKLFSYTNEPNGYCLAWSMFFTELCLKNPEIPSSNLMKYIFNILSNMNLDEQKRFLKRVIRGYVAVINEKITKYFSALFGENFTIDKFINLSVEQKTEIEESLKTLVSLDMRLYANPDPMYIENKLNDTLEAIKDYNEVLYDSEGNINDYAEEELEVLNETKHIYENYEKFTKFSNPSSNLSSFSKSSSNKTKKRKSVELFPMPTQVKGGKKKSLKKKNKK